MQQLNIGSGQRKFASPWVNVDKQAKWEPDVLWDAGNSGDKCPFEVNSCRTIVLHHVLEHFGCNEGNLLLGVCRSLLIPGGNLLVFVPDMKQLAHMWLEGRLSDQLYMTNLFGAYMGDDADRHRWGYTPDSLRQTLDSAGFKTYPFDWRSIKGADIAQDRWILGMEAIK